MLYIEYFLLPEAGYNGKYDRKEGHYIIKRGTIADMIHDSGMLLGYDFNNTIPSYVELNNILQTGGYGRLVEWDPVTVDENEYNDIVRFLLGISRNRPYRIE